MTDGPILAKKTRLPRVILAHLSQEQLEDFANKLAALLKSGDTLYLIGDLGAGKSTFARAIIQTIAEDENLEVPSPTFPLLIPYETPRLAIAHYDLYRLNDPSECEELGLYDTLDTHLTLIEWPEQLGQTPIKDRLEINLEESKDGQARSLTLSAHGTMQGTLERFNKICAFLKEAGWDQAKWDFLQGDASTRSYIRLHQNNQKALLMNAPPRPDGPPIQDGKPYSQIAHLAEDMTSFVAIAQTLGAAGFNLPHIHHHNVEQGLLLISDFGDDQYYDLIVNRGHDITSLYEPAIDVLADLRQHKPGSMPINDQFYALPKYDQQALEIETKLTIDWYWPYVKQHPCEGAPKEAFQAIWSDLFKQLESDNQNWVLRDYHSPNLIRLTDAGTNNAVGIIDFQDAVQGHCAYDVVSLCQDARLTINPEIEQHLLARYETTVQAQDPQFDAQAFKAAYAILGAQRANKLLGIFIRLSERDGKPHYKAHLPRTWNYLERNLEHPQLAPLKQWFESHFPPNLRALLFTKQENA